MATEISDAKNDPPPAWRPAISVLLPHPPIAVPAVGGERGARCGATTSACRQLAKRLVDRSPRRLVLVSPHTPRDRRAFGLVGGDRLHGDLARFGAPEAAVELPNDRQGGEALIRAAAGDGMKIQLLPPQPLDHGAVVPLYFLAEAGWRGPTLVLALPWRHTPDDGRRFGGLLARALGELGDRAALVASGDMSHRCLPDAPAGFHPRAVEFDRQLTRLVAGGDFAAIAEIDPELRELAAEDTSESTRIVTAAHDFDARGAEVLSYEHPFGVGYLVAVFFDGG